MTKTDPLVTDEQINTRTEIEYNVKTGMGVKHDIASAHMHGFRKGLIEMRDSYEKDRAALLKERDEASVYLNTLLAMFENDGCVYTAQALESELKDEIIAFLSTQTPTK